MSRRRALLGGAAALMVAPVIAAAQDVHHEGAPPASVAIAFVSYAPVQLDVLVGEGVTWTNGSVREHTVTADDQSFDSGRVASRGQFTHTFATPGQWSYHCDLHAGMQGTIGVHTLLLDAPPAAAGPGHAFPVTGRAALPAGADVTIQADTGGGFAAVGHTAVGPDGTFSTTVVPATTAQLRAVAGDAASPPVRLTVLDHRVALRARRARGGVLLVTHVTPPAPHATVVVQLLLPEHFGWWPVRRVRLDGTGAASIVLPLHRRVPARVLLTLPDGATPLAVSAVRRVGPRSRR